MGQERSELEREYSPSSCVDDVDGLLAAYRVASARARAESPPATHAYGRSPDERLDVFSAGPGTAAHVFVHGGYWQELSKDDASFPATGFVPAGVSYVAVGYGLAPAYPLDEIVAQIRRAVAWVRANAARLGLDAGRIVVSGSSAGAHLAAMAALTDDAGPGRGDSVRGLVLLSGVYDLVPLVDTYVNDAVGLDRAAAERNSPLARVRPAAAPIPAVIAWGEHETAAFKRQSARFADAWERAGNPVTRLEAPGRNHFDLVHDLADPATPLGAAVAGLHERVSSGS